MRVALLVAVAAGLVACVDVTMTHWERGPGDCAGAEGRAPWPTAAPDDFGLDGSALEVLAQRIERGELGTLHSLLVVREGTLVFERYFEGRDATWGRPLGRVAFDRDTLHDLRSVTKSVVGSLVGIALGDGGGPDLDASIASFFPERRLAPALGAIRLRHALSMSAGLAWDEFSHPYWDPRNDETAMWLRDDPLGYALSRASIAAPGASFAYNGGLPTVLSAVIEQATGTPLDRFAAERLFCPLGVHSFEWVRHGSGVHVAASGLRLRPRDLARFGWMMLEEGRFAGRQIVPAAYARSSLAVQIDTGGSLAEGYGYQWWVARIPEGEGHVELPLAIGNGGQRVVVHRSARLVVVVTAGSYDSPTQGDGPRAAIRAVLRAIRTAS